MNVPSPPIRFGVFEVYTRSGELRRQGSRINLQEQPFQALVLLLERPGEVVTREELRNRLWPQNTFVDFERGLNKAINKLRVALRDDSEKPRYIETLPHRGYRFIAPIDNVEQLRDHVHSHHLPPIDSLAVLPLDNLSGDPAQEYFSDGMTEELICVLAKIGSLRVISRTSVMMYKGSRKSLPAIARELGVDAVVEGSVARSEHKVRITAQLIHARDEKHLWSGRYERDLRDVLHMQEEIAYSIASHVHKLVAPEYSIPERARQVHPGAYEACLRGSFFRDRMTPVDLEKSIEFFSLAIALDPSYAQAYGDLSLSYFFLGLFGMGYSTEMFLKAKANALKAVELNEMVTAAHIALAAVHILYDWDWASAEAECRRALELSPGDAATHVHFADYMSIRGRHNEAIAEFNQVLERDPVSRVHLIGFGLILYRARRYDESIAVCRRALEIDPSYPNALWFLALSLEQRGELPEAIAKLENAVRLSDGPHYRALLGRAYALAGETAKTLSILGELKALSLQKYVSPFDFAVIHAGLGDRRLVFKSLEEAYEQRVFRIIELTMPMFDSLRSDPRWQDLVHRIGLAE